MWTRGGIYRLVFNASVWHSNIIHIASIIYSTQNILIAFDRPVCTGITITEWQLQEMQFIYTPSYTDYIKHFS